MISIKFITVFTFFIYLFGLLCLLSTVDGGTSQSGISGHPPFVLNRDQVNDDWLAKVDPGESHFRAHGQLIGSLNFAHLVFNMNISKIRSAINKFCEHQQVMLGYHVDTDDQAGVKIDVMWCRLTHRSGNNSSTSS